MKKQVMYMCESQHMQHVDDEHTFCNLELIYAHLLRKTSLKLNKFPLDTLTRQRGKLPATAQSELDSAFCRQKIFPARKCLQLKGAI